MNYDFKESWLLFPSWWWCSAIGQRKIWLIKYLIYFTSTYFFQFTHKQLNSKHWTSIWIAYSMYVYLYVNRYYAEMYWWIAWYYIQQGIIFITQRNIFRNFYQELYFCVCVRPLFPQVLLSIWHASHNNKSRKSTTLTKFCKTHFVIAKKRYSI